MRSNVRQAPGWTVARSIFIARVSVIASLALPVLLSHQARADDTISDTPAAAWHQDGQASYYGRHWNGHRTSSGAVFDPKKMTAASATLPLGTKLLVTSTDSGESVVVTVNDRQPDHGDRIIDLSPAAARRLGMIGAGVAEVVLTKATAIDSSENDEEVAEAPDEAPDLEVSTPRVHHISRVRHGLPHRHLARR